ncbi:hypothetical protein [Propionimicrobium sp. PCR01-08-3]|uniref:hypothetical protein n=1 Tax=Propionimicrobium sp. PCR01-08-3 TaxID=3052086 RepID=UPI00255C2E20|nr:hypothetical protein [Propionimicrobium sp. PCR01-08-3]WIY83177.1 hypothetical protein QQ658_02115 [Propionimicrobium sp. PCR01-08-3]
MDALYAEAEQVFRRSMELRNQFEGSGDYSEFPAELNELLADPYLDSVHQLFDFGRENGLHGPAGVGPALTVARYPGVSKGGSEVALRACLDSRDAPALDADGEVFSEGGLFHMKLFFKHFEGSLKLFDGTTGSVDECPFG